MYIDKSNKQRGWVLIDSLIGMVIVVIALLAMITMYTQATKTTNANKNYNTAVYLAQEYLEDLKRYDNDTTGVLVSLPEDLANPEPIQKDGVVYTVRISSITVVTNPPLDSRIHPYQATITWSDPVNRSIQVVAYYYSN